MKMLGMLGEKLGLSLMIEMACVGFGFELLFVPI